LRFGANSLYHYTEAMCRIKSTTRVLKEKKERNLDGNYDMLKTLSL